jgi:hypothetical protein
VDNQLDKGAEQQPIEATKFEPAPRYVEIEVPNDSAIFFYKAGLKAGIEAMEQNKKFLALAGDEGTSARIGSAITALTAFLDTVREVEADIIQEFQEFQRQSMQQNMPQGMTVGFAPRIETVPGDED